MAKLWSDDQQGRLAIVTYLLYIVFYESLILGGCGYAVFVLGHSGWWFVLAALFSGACFKPKTWRQLWDDTADSSDRGW